MNVLSLFDGIACARVALERANLQVTNYYASEIDEFAIQIAKHNYPDIIQLGSIENWESWDLPPIDLLIGGSPCFVKGTKVICRDSYKNIEDVQVGDYVLTHKNRFQRVLKTGSREAETYLLKAQGIKPTETTEEHPYYVREMTRKWDNLNRTSRRVFSEPKWKPVKELDKGDFIGLPIIDVAENPLDLTEEDCWLLGRFIADGHYRRDKRKHRKNSYYYSVIFSVGSHKVEEFQRQVTRQICIKEHSQSTHRIVLNSMSFVELLEQLGLTNGAINKHIPMTLLRLPRDLLKRVIEGYMSGDGYFKKKANTYKATSISETLIMTLNLAIAKVYGVNSSYEYTKRPPTHVIDGRTVNQHDTYQTTYRMEMKKQSNAEILDGIVWLPVKGVEVLKRMQMVYNLEVEQDNSYTANNVIVHNCQGFSFAGKRLNFDDPRSALFFKFAEVLKALKPKHFLLENVRMVQEHENVISEYLNVTPIMINSARLSAQNRVRLYWTSIQGIKQPKDKGLVLKDVLEDVVDPSKYKRLKTEEYKEELCQTPVESKHEDFVNRDKSYCVDACYGHLSDENTYFTRSRRQMVFKVGAIRGRKEEDDQPYEQQLEVRPDDKSNTITSVSKDNVVVQTGLKKIKDLSGDYQSDQVYSTEGKSVSLCANGGGGGAKTGLYSEDNITWRNLTPLECERLQTLPDRYTEVNNISDVQRYKCLGNGFTVDVITHILSYIPLQKEGQQIHNIFKKQLNVFDILS